MRANSFNHSSCQWLKIIWDELETIEIGAFNNLDSLSSLCLFNNKLTAIDSGTFSGLSSLNRLQLQNNRLVKLQSHSFDGLKSLTSLYLQNNYIFYLPPLIFSSLLDLQILNIQNNELFTISWDIFSSEIEEHPTIIFLALSGNPLTCNISACWMYEGEYDKWLSWLGGISSSPECTDLTSWSKITSICGIKGKQPKILDDYCCFPVDNVKKRILTRKIHPPQAS